jgi:hypothetical protein
MISGFSTTTLTLVHVIISLVGMLAGPFVVQAMLRSRLAAGWTAIFLTSLVLTDVTGFFLPSAGVTPAQIVGVLSLAVLAGALLALYAFNLSGAWRWIYVVGALIAFYFDVFVGVVQAFQKIPFLAALAPTQSEPPFVVAQLATLIVFVALGFAAIRKFHPEVSPRSRVQSRSLSG